VIVKAGIQIEVVGTRVTREREKRLCGIDEKKNNNQGNSNGTLSSFGALD